jgi:uncharacterized protein with GYD domain
MAIFIMTGRYSAEAIEHISGERTTKAIEIVQQCGGKIVASYATMGETDLLVITEFSGASEAIKASVALNKALGVSFSTVPAVRIEEFDELVGNKEYDLAQ